MTLGLIEKDTEPHDRENTSGGKNAAVPPPLQRPLSQLVSRGLMKVLFSIPSSLERHGVKSCGRSSKGMPIWENC